jgi:hypothetical protein
MSFILSKDRSDCEPWRNRQESRLFVVKQQLVRRMVRQDRHVAGSESRLKAEEFNPRDSACRRYSKLLPKRLRYGNALPIIES